MVTLVDTEALGRFLAGAERRAFRMAEIATRDREEALDLVQDSMYKLVQRYGAHDESEWAPLFYRILQSRIRDWHRRRAVRSRFRVWLGGGDAPEAEDPLEALPDRERPDPEGGAQSARALERLERALGELPRRQQQVFLLRAWEGLSVAETAQAMRSSQGTVKTHYHRAIRALRERLGEDEP